jgi:hypothetical protein
VKKAKLLISLVLGVVLVVSQITVATASQSTGDLKVISGTVQSITLETNPNSGVTTLVVMLVDGENTSQTVRISQETAYELGLISWDEDGNPVINESTLGQSLDIDPASVIPANEPARHPVGNALATFFSDIESVDYTVIMSAHEEGHGFGVIAQVLWIARKLAGEEANLELFTAILNAKQDGDFSDFVFEDGIPLNWGQFKKAVLDGDKKVNLGSVISGPSNIPEHGNAGGNGNGNNNNGNNRNQDKEKGKDKEKDNSGNGNGNNNRP